MQQPIAAVRSHFDARLESRARDFGTQLAPELAAVRIRFHRAVDAAGYTINLQVNDTLGQSVSGKTNNLRRQEIDSSEMRFGSSGA